MNWGGGCKWDIKRQVFSIVFVTFCPKNHLFSPNQRGKKTLKKFPLCANIFNFWWENDFQKRGGVIF